MQSLFNRRGYSIRERLARACFSLARKLLGQSPPRYYEHYARKVPEAGPLEIALDKVTGSGPIEPDSHRDALLRLATEVGNVRREQLIMRLALHDARILILPPDELANLIKLYHIIGD